MDNRTNGNTTRCSVLIIGAGISGLSAAKVLAENGVEDMVILEAADRIGGRLRKEEFGGHMVELGAGWIAGVGGEQMNPVWELATQCGLRTCFSDYSNARYNIFDCNGKMSPREIAAESYEKGVEAAIDALKSQKSGGHYTNETIAPKAPLELAVDFMLHDFEMAEAEPFPTFVDYGEKEYLVADERGYNHLVYKLAETFLYTTNGKILDSRLKLNKVVSELHHTTNGVTVKTEDGSVYKANYVIVSVSIGVLQSQLISFSPPLPRWKTEAFSSINVAVYTKVFLKFPHKFWPCGADKEFFIYAHEKRGYYTFWQNMENAYPGSNILIVTLTNGESKRIEAQSDQETLKEAMEVLRNMFGNDIPDAIDILVPRWWSNCFQRGSYSKYPVCFNHQLIDNVKAPVGRVYFAGEHTSTKYNGYVHGAYLSGIDTSKVLLEEMRIEKEKKLQNQRSLLKPLFALTLAQPDALLDITNQLFIHSPKRASRSLSFAPSESYYISA